VLVPLALRQDELEKYRVSSPQTYRLLLEQPQFLDMLIQNRLRDPAALEETRKQIEDNLKDGRKFVAGRNNLTEEEFDLSLAKLRGVARMLGAYNTAPRLSDARAVMLGRDRFDSVLASVVAIPAEAFVDPAWTPGEGELKAHFEKYRESEAGSGEMGFGYVLPERFKLEWFKLDRATISEAITIDPVEANLYWRENRAAYPGEFATERERVVEALKGRKVTDALSDAERAYKARLRASTRSLQSDAGVKRLTNDWQPPSMASLAQGVVEGLASGPKLTIAQPVIESRGGEWVRLTEVPTLPGIGGAKFNIGNQSLSFAQMLAQTHELGAKMDLGLQERVPFEGVLNDDIGNRYCFVVLNAQKSAPAPTLDDARADVTRDVHLLRAFNELVSKMPEYQGLAAVEGLEAVAKKANEDKRDATRSIGILHDQTYTRVQSPQGSMDNDEGEVRTALLQQARVLGLLTQATPENMPLRTVGVAIPQTRHVVVGQVGGAEPLTVQALRTINSRVADSLVREEVTNSTDGEGPYSAEGLKQRLGFQAVGEKPVQTPGPGNAP
jgi:hypothetical protein